MTCSANDVPMAESLAFAHDEAIRVVRPVCSKLLEVTYLRSTQSTRLQSHSKDNMTLDSSNDEKTLAGTGEAEEIKYELLRSNPRLVVEEIAPISVQHSVHLEDVAVGFGAREFISSPIKAEHKCPRLAIGLCLPNRRHHHRYRVPFKTYRKATMTRT